MCIFWTCKYTLCGCIWDMDPSRCLDKRLCWGPRMITLESVSATCGDCWVRGDKRVSKGSDNADQGGSAANSTIPACVREKDGSEKGSYEGEEYFQAEEYISPLPSSRPPTPQLYYEIRSALCPVEEDNDFDLTRACDPVDVASIGRDYRARCHTKLAFGYLSDDESDDTGSFVSCEEYLGGEARREELDIESDQGDGSLRCIVRWLKLKARSRAWRGDCYS